MSGALGACNGITNSVTFVFGVSAATTLLVCDNALSQFATASVYLDHTTDCRDYLGFYNAPCGPRMWLSEPVTCGETSARPCSCGGTHQASLSQMLDKYGASCVP